MRDISRIPRIIAQLEHCWLKAPDMRAGQLIENIRSFSGIDDLYYIEDDDFETLLDEFYEMYLSD